jgi:L-asparaginase
MKKILLLQTGGTIAMQLHKQEAHLNPEMWRDVLYKQMPELLQVAEIDVKSVFSEDSSELNRHHWKTLAEVIYSNIDHYDGFVVLHGTDTMAYTASALSFALQHIQKPIIFTGSQVPMSNIRSDAKRNVVNAVELATHPIHEVAICFNDHLFRGNRSTKMSIGDFDAFSSPNYPALANIGINIRFSDYANRKNRGELTCRPAFDNSIHLIKLYPGLNTELLNCIDLKRTKAIVFEAFGIGNFPIKGENNLIPFIKKCKENNCHILVTSQAAYDAVDLNQYAGGRAVRDLGGISCGEMTIEASITKTMYLLGMQLKPSVFKTKFLQNIAGERE